MKYGYLRETKELAQKAGLDPDTHLIRTGLDEYLKIIFPLITDWVHDKSFGGDNKLISRKRPDYRSDSLKLIIEIDGLPHYQKPDQIEKDKINTKLYSEAGYKVVRIPYFIQLTRSAIYKLFGVKLDFNLFDVSIPSLTIHSQATPAYLCVAGIQRMAADFKKFPEQYDTNLKYLKSLPPEYDNINGVNFLEYFYNK